VLTPRTVCVAPYPHGLSLAMHRVAQALEATAPEWATLVRDRDAADVAVHHVIGLTGWDEALAAGRARGQRFAWVQYCLRTTEDSRPEAWLPMWREAALVWSYYDLAAHVGAADGDDLPFRFYHAPMGVDGRVFSPSWRGHAYEIGTSGYVAESEGVREACEAVRRVGGRQFHLGPDLGFGPEVRWATGLTDGAVASYWSACRYVAGLRRGEGFELPALEGLACGARAVCFDAPHYREWFGEHAEYVPEAAADEVADALERLLRGPYREVTRAERDHVAQAFDWASIATGFWQELEAGL